MSPRTVAFLRGLAEAVAMAALTFGLEWIQLAEDLPAAVHVWFPVIVLGLRTLEGVVDQTIDPTKQRRLGGGPAVIDVDSVETAAPVRPARSASPDPEHIERTLAIAITNDVTYPGV